MITNFPRLLKSVGMVVLLLCALLGSGPLMAQQSALRGSVVDQNGQPVIGATVSVDGTTTGTITDMDGVFELRAKQGAAITVQFIGYDNAQATLAQGVKVVLSEGAVDLGDVVVVGYGVQRKATLTGAVAAISSEELSSKGTLSTPLQALQGSVPGVTITRTSSAPGDEGWNLKLRGSSSMNSADPLIIIDGIEAQGGTADLGRLNPDDIESMNFLKDASAAIYGSKAAGGVVLVTTKKAQEGRTKVNYGGSYTIKTIGLQPDMMSLDEWCESITTAQSNDGYTIETSNWMKYAALAQAYKGSYISAANSPDPLNNFFAGGVEDYVFMDTDWNDIMWGNSFSTQHDLSVEGGTDKHTYRVSAGYMFNDSNLQWGNDFKERYNVRLNNTYKLSEKFSLQSSISYSRETTVSPTFIGEVLTSANPQPGLPSETIGGQPYAWGAWKTPNWLAELGGDNELKVNVFTINEQLRYSITDKISATIQGGYTNNSAIRDVVSNAIDWYTYDDSSVTWQYPTQEESEYKKSYAETEFYTTSGVVNYNDTFADDHNVGVMVGAQYDYKAYERSEMKVLNVNSSLEVPSGSGTITIDPDKWHEGMMSTFGRVNYDYKSKYLVDANFRYDGSSKFLPENRWAFFWGTSLGWRISEESFFEPIKTWVTDLKIRGSYGELGNQSGIGRYDGVQLYNYYTSSGIYVDGEQLSYITTPNTIASSGRTWERIYTYNFGVDFGLFSNRLKGTYDVFLNKNNNMLISADYSGVLGGNAPETNIGKFKSKGWEVSLNWSDKIGNVRYSVGGNISYSTNIVTDINASTVIKAGLNKAVEGYPLNSYFGLQYAGKVQDQDDLKKYSAYYYENNGISMPTTLRLGDNMFQDTNKDGKLNSEDYVYLGTDSPEISYSFNVNLNWKWFDLSAQFQGVANRTIMRDGASAIPMRAAWLNSSNFSMGKVWSESNRDGYYPAYSNTGTTNTYNYQCSSWSVENGAYLRLKNVSLGYSLPQNIIERQNVISAMRVYFTGADLWEYTKIRDGWDPEQSSKVSSTERYPFNRTFTFGINLTF